MDFELEGIGMLKPEETGHVFKPWVASHWEKMVKLEREERYVKLDLIVHSMEFESYLK